MNIEANSNSGSNYSNEENNATKFVITIIAFTVFMMSYVHILKKNENESQKYLNKVLRNRIQDLTVEVDKLRKKNEKLNRKIKQNEIDCIKTIYGVLNLATGEGIWKKS